MHNTTYKILLAISVVTLSSCGILKNSRTDEAPNDSVLPSADNATHTHIATDLKYEVLINTAESDTCSFDVPESMTTNTDSLLSSWQARTLLKRLDCNTTGWENIKMTDTMYAKRLSSMLTIVKMPYNNMVSSCIDRYAKKNRSQVSYMLGISVYDSRGLLERILSDSTDILIRNSIVLRNGSELEIT